MSTERGNLLYQTGRYDLAQQEYRAALAQSPDDARAHAMLGLCLLRQNQYAAAADAAQQAITLQPDWSFGYAALAQIMQERDRLPEALAAIERAIALDPYDPYYLSTLAYIRLKQRKWPEALAAADRGLEVDPEHPGCINARGMALVQLGRRDEADQTMKGALARDPHNALTHANQGWALLHQGDHRAAMEHFREALRADPEMQWAKAGIVEAMKAKNPIYRVMLRYFLFMSRLSARAQWAIVIGGYLGYRILAQIRDSNPSLSPFILPVMIAYIVFAFMSWLSGHAFNLLLRMSRFGRYVLSRDQRVASNWFAAGLLAALALAGAFFVTHNDEFLVAALLTGVMTAPITSVYLCPAGWPRRAMGCYAAGLAALAALCIDLDVNDPRGHFLAAIGMPGDAVYNVLLVGILGSGFVANALIASRVKK